MYVHQISPNLELYTCVVSTHSEMYLEYHQIVPYKHFQNISQISFKYSSNITRINTNCLAHIPMDFQRSSQLVRQSGNIKRWQPDNMICASWETKMSPAGMPCSSSYTEWWDFRLCKQNYKDLLSTYSNLYHH